MSPVRVTSSPRRSVTVTSETQAETVTDPGVERVVIEKTVQPSVVIREKVVGERVLSGVGTQGPPGAPADPSLWRYVHNQGGAATIWTIVHNLGYFPNVMVTDSARAVIWTDVVYVNENTVEVHFSAPQSGFAFLS